MRDKTIIIKKEEVTKKFSELTEEEKAIYNAGFDSGWAEGGFVVLGLLVFIIIALVISSWKS